MVKEIFFGSLGIVELKNGGILDSLVINNVLETMGKIQNVPIQLVLLIIVLINILIIIILMWVTFVILIMKLEVKKKKQKQVKKKIIEGCLFDL